MSDVSPVEFGGEGRSATLSDIAPDHLLQAFAHPGSGAGALALDGLERILFSAHARRVIHAVLENAAADVTNRMPGLERVLREWCASETASHWSRPVGALWRGCETGEVEDVPSKLAELGLEVSFGGVSGDWEFRQLDPISVRIGSYMASNVVSGCVECDGRSLRCTLSTLRGDGLSLTARSTSSVDAAMSVDRVEGGWTRLQLVQSGWAKLVLIPSDLVGTELLPSYAESAFQSLSERGETGLALADGLRFIEQSASKFVPWVSILREVVPLRSLGGSLASSSSPWDCGVAAVTVTQKGAAVAEMLVHEASHQHFFVAKHLGRLEDGSDQRQYYSPMVSNNRPLEKMILAYHALGNMVIMHSEMIRADLAVSGCHERMSALGVRLRLVEPVVLRSTALTRLGQALVRPLAERVERLREDRILT